MARIYIAPQILSANAFDPLSATIKAPIRTIMDPAAEKIPFRPLLAGIISVTILVAIDGKKYNINTRITPCKQTATKDLRNPFPTCDHSRFGSVAIGMGATAIYM